MEETTDINRELMLDANATAGVLYEIFGVEMTASPTECANCGNEGEIGELLAFTQGPGIVLRCSTCENWFCASFKRLRRFIWMRVERSICGWRGNRERDRQATLETGQRSRGRRVLIH